MLGANSSNKITCFSEVTKFFTLSRDCCGHAAHPLAAIAKSVSHTSLRSLVKMSVQQCVTLPSAGLLYTGISRQLHVWRLVAYGCHMTFVLSIRLTAGCHIN